MIINIKSIFKFLAFKFTLYTIFRNSLEKCKKKSGFTVFTKYGRLRFKGKLMEFRKENT